MNPAANKPLGIFFLDAGRKYFGVPAIRKLLGGASREGLDMMQLYVSDNQGFRFAPGDRVVRTPYGVYDLTPALGDGYCQEDKAPDGSGRYLTQEDMEKILDYARQVGVEIIPALNMPGHMGAILEHFPHLRYPGSRSSLNLGNPEAVAFGLALAEQYAAYFAGRGCRFFNFCADEFANDLGTMGLDLIYHNGDMKHFVSFVNGLAERIAQNGMVPMAFNDGIYYHDDKETYGTIDSRIWVQYWIAGWEGYRPASAATLAEAGFHLINANHRYYCGAGQKDWESHAELVRGFDGRVFDRDTVIPQPAGAMLCCWCDRADADGPDGGQALAGRLLPVIAAFGQAMRDWRSEISCS